LVSLRERPQSAPYRSKQAKVLSRIGIPSFRRTERTELNERWTDEGCVDSWYCYA
jgi:hypothetical protein